MGAFFLAVLPLSRVSLVGVVGPRRADVVDRGVPRLSRRRGREVVGVQEPLRVVGFLQGLHVGVGAVLVVVRRAVATRVVALALTLKLLLCELRGVGAVVLMSDAIDARVVLGIVPAHDVPPTLYRRWTDVFR